MSPPGAIKPRPLPATGIIALCVGVALITGCGSASGPSSRPTEPKNAAGVRANLYAFYRDERTGNTAAACASVTPSNQRKLMAEEKVSSCEAAFFKRWNTNSGIFSEAKEAELSAHSLRRAEQEVAKEKIIVVGDHATVIAPGREETEEYVYAGGRWLFLKAEKNTNTTTEELRKEAEEREAKNKAALEIGEAQGNSSEIAEAG